MSLFVGQVMSPHHSDQMSHRSYHISGIALQMIFSDLVSEHTVEKRLDVSIETDKQWNVKINS